ncbi:periodic tryptophan protein 1 homolog [Chelonus insularis]|uniref:periodic tryptophan protein 1 homolog n=1 Tax=Chelonus insularis TaxID=460826 RepID=UPI00158853BA|nr:periodic tryptophan protein 1 homolog [Chelonus insularis]
MNVIPCTTWVKKGVAAAVPDKVQLTPQELESIIKKTQSELENAESDSEDGENEASSSTNNPAPRQSNMESDEFDFENYDEEAGEIQCHIGSLAVVNSEGRDPLVTIPDSEDEDSEKEDDIIKPDDNLVILGHVEGDASILEIFVYNEKENSFYCHHDLLLPAFPLCLEWLNFDPSDAKPANFCAIGNMTPIIEVWDLDLIDGLEPAFKLGSKPNKKKQLKRIGHKKAVLDLAWNHNFTHVLASGSVDETVLLWDLENGTPVTKLSQFNEKVQSIQWHPKETQKLLTGCADKTVKVFDCRVDDTFKSWETTGEVERVLWNHFDPNYFFISTDNGNIEYIDSRQGKHLWEVKAHEKEVTGLSLSSSCPGLLVTTSNDGVIKVWDAVNHESLTEIWEKKLNLGNIQCLAACPDNPFVFAVGGDNKSHNFKLWDLTEITDVINQFKDRRLIENVGEQAGLNEENQSNVEMMDVTDNMETVTINTGKKKKGGSSKNCK